MSAFGDNLTTPYFYIKNLMGDICEIADKDGNTVASYYYDAWGTLLKSEGDENILRMNPLTYRGYLYDEETGLYYLQTRYYNPEWNRFLNADTNLDTQTSIIGTNVFAYCNNNPVMQSDPTGQAGEYMDWLKNSPLTAAIKFLSLGIAQWLQDTFSLSDSLIIGLYDGLAALGKIFSDGMKLIYDVFVGDTISIISSIIEFGHSFVFLLGKSSPLDAGIYSGIISSFSILLNLGTRLAKGGGSIDKYFIRDTVTDVLGAVFNIGFAVFSPPGTKLITAMLASTLVPKVITIIGRYIVRWKMKKIKFRIHRTFGGYVVYQFLYQLLPVLIEFFIFLVAQQRDNLIAFYIFLPFILPLNIMCLFRDSVTFKNDQLIIKTAYIPAWEFKVDITTVSNVHYRNKSDEIVRTRGGFFVALSKNEYTVCFIDNKDISQQISTKDHAKLYALLKAREKIE